MVEIELAALGMAAYPAAMGLVDPPRRADLKGLGDGYTLSPVRWRDGAQVYELARTKTIS